MSDSEASQSSESSQGSEGDGGHPLDAAVQGRHSGGGRAGASAGGGGRRRERSRSRSPGTARPASSDDADDFEAALSSGTSSSSGGGRGGGSSGSESDAESPAGSGSSGEEEEEEDAGPAKPQRALPAPVGVIVVEEREEGPTYFDPDVEEAGLRCFKCGGKGHMARDCTNPAARQRSCFLCAAFGHDSRDCPSALCWRCQRPGHMARDCPYGYRAAPWGAKDEAPTCLRCGREDCPCAGQKDYVRASGGCAFDYSPHDLQHVRCFTCGRRGHPSCKPLQGQAAPKPSCANCGEGRHTAGGVTGPSSFLSALDWMHVATVLACRTAFLPPCWPSSNCCPAPPWAPPGHRAPEECPQEPTQVMRNERLGSRPPPREHDYDCGDRYQQQQQYGGYRSGGGYQQQQYDRCGGGYGGGYSGGRHVRFASYSAYAEIEQPPHHGGQPAQSAGGKRRHSDPGYGGGGGYNSGGGKRARR
eukprot:scaffold4.g4719.t1